jgi:peptidase C10 family
MTKQITFKLFIGISLALVASCTTEDYLPHNASSTKTEKQSVQRSSAEALAIAAELFSNTSTRSNKQTGDLNVFGVLSAKHMTRSANEKVADTSTFVVNRGSDEGFVYISGDRRCEPVLGFSETGHIAPSDLENNPGLSLFNRLNNYRTAVISINDTPEYTPDHDSAEGQRVYYYKDYRDSVIFYRYQKGYQALPDNLQWGQDDPYNRKAEIRKDKYGVKQRCLAGCVPVATAQYLAYYRHPQVVNGQKINWKSIHKRGDHDQINQISTLIRALGDLYQVEWGIHGTGVYKENKIYSVIPDLGYELAKYENARVVGNDSIVKILVNQLESRKGPFLIQGMLTEDVGTGHMWIVDGVAQFVRIKKIKDPKTQQYTNREYWAMETMKDRYLHMNWGWGGRNNGYFLAGVFRTDKYTDLDDIWAWDGDRFKTFHDKHYDLSVYLQIWRYTPRK